MRHRLWLVMPVTAAVGLFAVACGDPKVASQQAVLWFGLGAAPSATCSSIKNYQIPDGARATVSGSSGLGERVEDGGDDLVECDVRPASGSTTSYTVSLRFQGGEVGNFVASGTLDKTSTSNTVDVSFNTGQFSLAQSRCTVAIDTLEAGAIWLKSLHCDGLRDPSSPGILCDGQGGVIFENCSH